MIKQGLQIGLLMPAVATQKLRLVLLQQWWNYVQRCSDLGWFRPRMGPDLWADLHKMQSTFFRSFGTPVKAAGSGARVAAEQSTHE